jgi:peptidyl-prolyl cis-trans isomerase B (cyclophilin B)
MRRPAALVLCACALALAACGDDEENVGGGSGATTAATTQTGTATQPGAEKAACKDVAQPKARKASKQKKPSGELPKGKTYTAVIETNCGTVEIQLAASRAPKTAASFVSLARAKFYDGLAFHRIVPGFVVQGGDPAGDGSGGPGYSVVETPPGDLKYTEGVVAMAKTELDEPGTSGSQFFIVTAPDAGLPPDYALLGRVTKGQAAVRAMEQVPAEPDGRPSKPVVMQTVRIKTS